MASALHESLAPLEGLTIFAILFIENIEAVLISAYKVLHYLPYTRHNHEKIVTDK